MAHVYSAMFVVQLDYLAPKSYSEFHLIGGLKGWGGSKDATLSSWWELELCKNRDDCKALSSHYLIQAQKYIWCLSRRCLWVLSSIGGGSDKSFVGCGNLLDILVLNPVDFVCSSFIKTWLSGFFRVLSP
jgi:hypothetical protein